MTIRLSLPLYTALLICPSSKSHLRCGGRVVLLFETRNAHDSDHVSASLEELHCLMFEEQRKESVPEWVFLPEVLPIIGGHR